MPLKLNGQTIYLPNEKQQAKKALLNASPETDKEPLIQNDESQNDGNKE